MIAADQTESRAALSTSRRSCLCPSVRASIGWLLVSSCLLTQLGCGSLSDPATQFAYCLEAAATARSLGSTTTNATCDLGMPGEFLLVLHPQGALREQDLVSAGVSTALLDEFRILRITDNAAIYVVATGPGVTGFGTSRSIRSTRTTYQQRFINIERVMVLAKDTQPVGVDITGPPGRREVVAVH